MKQDYIIVPQNYKKSLIKKLSKQNNLYKAKILGIDEVTKRLLFDYDEKTIYYLIKEKNYSYENAKELIKNMYFIKNTNYQNDKLNNLVTLKNELLEKNLLTTDKFFKNSIKNKNVEISRLSYGIPVGTEIDYLDALTLERAFEDRRNL